MDDEISVKLSDIRTVDQMAISETCIAKKEDLKKLPHLCDLPMHELDRRNHVRYWALRDT